MRVKFLRDFGGDNTLGVFYLAGAVVDLPDVNAAGLLRRGGVVEQVPWPPKTYMTEDMIADATLPGQAADHVAGVGKMAKGRKR